MLLILMVISFVMVLLIQQARVKHYQRRVGRLLNNNKIGREATRLTLQSNIKLREEIEILNKHAVKPNRCAVCGKFHKHKIEEQLRKGYKWYQTRCKDHYLIIKTTNQWTKGKSHPSVNL